MGDSPPVKPGGPLVDETRAMRPPRNPNPLPTTQARANEARRHGRLRSEILRCGLGKVVDLSASGMRVLSKGAPFLDVGKTVKTDLVFGGQKLSVKAQLNWVNKEGFRKYHMGFEFLDVTPQTRRGLVDMARSAIVCVDPGLVVRTEG